MIAIELNEQQAAMLRDLLEAQMRDLRHEIHHTDDRGFKQILRQKEALLEHLLSQLPRAAGAVDSR